MVAITDMEDTCFEDGPSLNLHDQDNYAYPNSRLNLTKHEGLKARKKKERKIEIY